uniref:Uncharacterized protein n=1 Tax=Compsopogon caeruleus TaxID=31354 RepID=A0A7S1TBJ1_9RHOD
MYIIYSSRLCGFPIIPYILVPTYFLLKLLLNDLAQSAIGCSLGDATFEIQIGLDKLREVIRRQPWESCLLLDSHWFSHPSMFEIQANDKMMYFGNEWSPGGTVRTFSSRHERGNQIGHVHSGGGERSYVWA